MKKKISMILCIAAMLMTVACGKENAEGGAETNSTETTANDIAETSASETEPAETEEPYIPYDYANNDLTAFITVGNYIGLDVSTRSPELTEEEYQEELAYLLESYADYEKITDRAVVEGDYVVTSYAGYLDGVAFDGGTSASASVTAADGMGYIDGFGPAFVGQMPGVEFSFDVTFPEDYGNSDLAGKEVTFVCTISYIEGENLVTPELTDEFVINTFGFENVEEFHTEFRAYTEEEKAYEVASEVNSGIWDQILENTVVAGYPEGEVEYYINLIKGNMEDTAELYGYDYDVFVELYTGMTAEEYEVSVVEQAESYVRENMVIHQIAKMEGISVTEERFNEKVQEIADANGVSAEVIINYYGEDDLKLSFLQEDVLTAIKAMANVAIEETTAE